MAPKAVHLLRVALRRLEAELTIAQAILGRRGFKRVRTKVRTSLRVLGALRDAQMQRKQAARMTLRDKAFRELAKHWGRREQRLRRSAAQTLASSKIGHQTSSILRQLQSLATAPRELLKRRLTQLRIKMKNQAAARLPRTSAEMGRLHRGRKAVKRYHLALEALQELLPDIQRQDLRKMTRLQNLMGEIHDMDLLIARLDRSVRKDVISSGTIRRERSSLVRRRSTEMASYLQLAGKFWVRHNRGRQSM